MEQNNSREKLDSQHEEYWTKPDKHALVRELYNGIEYYSIYQLEPKLMMMLCDDFEYASRLSKRMIENGVRIFDSFPELYNQLQDRK